MTTQPPITEFFGSKKRRATDVLEGKTKLLKSDFLLKMKDIDAPFEKANDQLPNFGEKNTIGEPNKQTEMKTPKKKTCDIRSYMTSKSPYRPECKSETPVKFFKLESKAKENETTPSKPVISVKSSVDRPQSAVKKSIRFEEVPHSTTTTVKEKKTVKVSLAPELEETDDIIKAANELVEKMKNKSQKLSDLGGTKLNNKKEVLTPDQLKKKLSKTKKLSELKSSLSRLGQHASELIKLEKKKKENEQPKLTKFDSFEIDVPRSPHKGALPSPIKSPAKPAYERFAHLIQRTGPVSSAPHLPLPLCYQRLLDLFIATDTVCSMMLNRGEIITFRKLKPAVQELTRKTLTERHIAQMATVLPEAFDFHQEKLRNFGSTSKIDKYELVLTPLVSMSLNRAVVGQTSETSNLVTAAENKKITPKILQMRRDAFSRTLLERTIDKHEEFLASLDPPLTVVRSQLTRWHPNFPVDLVPDVPPASLPEPPNVGQAPTSARDVLERAKQLLNANVRMRNALEAAARTADAENIPHTDPSKVGNAGLDPAIKASVDKRVAAHDPLKGISKSLLDKIRAKQAAKALEAMKASPADQEELLLLSKLPDTARLVRTLFIDNQKGVLPWETVLEKVLFSSKRTISKGEVEAVIRRLIKELPDWLSAFHIKNVEYLKLNRTTPLAPIMEKLDKMAVERRPPLS